MHLAARRGHDELLGAPQPLSVDIDAQVRLVDLGRRNRGSCLGRLFDDFADQLGHVHFDVEFGEVSEGVDLDVSEMACEQRFGKAV